MHTQLFRDHGLTITGILALAAGLPTVVAEAGRGAQLGGLDLVAAFGASILVVWAIAVLFGAKREALSPERRKAFGATLIAAAVVVAVVLVLQTFLEIYRSMTETAGANANVGRQLFDTASVAVVVAPLAMAAVVSWLVTLEAVVRGSADT